MVGGSIVMHCNVWVCVCEFGPVMLSDFCTFGLCGCADVEGGLDEQSVRRYL